MSRDSRARNKRKKAATRKRLVSNGNPAKAFSRNENAALALVTCMTDVLDKEAPLCDGRIVVHDSGAFECVRGACTAETLLDHLHWKGIVHRCDNESVDETRTVCRRCWSRQQFAEPPECAGMLVVHEDGKGGCTAWAEGCPGVNRPHSLLIPCRALRRCAVCGTDNEAARQEVVKQHTTRQQRRSTYRGGLWTLESPPPPIERFSAQRVNP